MASIPPIISWDYPLAANAQKIHTYLTATSTPFQICELPFLLPRPQLTDLGITYRRVPVLSIGKDVFCDTIAFIDAMQDLLEKEGEGRALKRSIADRAFEAWGYRSFWVALPCAPAQGMTEEVMRDRKDVFPVFATENYASLRPNALSEFRSMLHTAETVFLGDEGPFIGGSNRCALADVHASWMLRWALQTAGVALEPGFDATAFPRVYRWIDALPSLGEGAREKQTISCERAKRQVLESQYACADIGIDPADPLKLIAGERVVVSGTDAKPGCCAQEGRLDGLSRSRIVLELENGIRVHLPRIGYRVDQAHM